MLDAQSDFSPASPLFGGMKMMSLLLVVAAVLTSIAQQEASPPAPSVAEAARAARERQKPASAKHVLTDEDLGGSRETGGSGAPASEAEARSQLERDPTVPAKPTIADLKQSIHDFSVASSRDQPAQDFRHGGLYESFKYKNVDFPGKKEWEEEMETALTHLHAESHLAAPRLQAILDQNQDALSRGDPSASPRVRKQMIDALVPNIRWQMRFQQLWQEGQERAKAYLSNSAAALNDYGQSQGKRGGTMIGYTLIDLNDKEEQFRRAHGRYTCDLSEFNFIVNQRQLKSSDVGWQTKLARVHELGYQITMQGCDANHYVAMAAPPAPDGSQGRALCTSESRGIRIAEDGRSLNCLSKGSEWHGE
jgi:hypothetical protein